MSINKDQVDGRVKEAAGKVQEVAGRVTGSHTQEAKGAINKNLGAAQAKVGDVTEKAKGALKDAQKDSERETRDPR
ncbi:MAG TPA: CsbD family protein [Steroidobacteraceae bacterium]|nr:CsbD family protein [Steroidobacteraceae bacterium]